MDCYRVFMIESFYYKKPFSVFNLFKLLSVNNAKELNNIGKYLSSAFQMRAQHCDDTTD